MSAWTYYAVCTDQGPEISLDKHTFSNFRSRPSPCRQHFEDSSQKIRGTWGALTFDIYGSSWLARAVEEVQIKWWYCMSGRVGGLEFEIGADENEYRRDTRFVAMADVSFQMVCSVFISWRFCLPGVPLRFLIALLSIFMTWGFRLKFDGLYCYNWVETWWLLSYDYHITRFAFTSTYLYLLINCSGHKTQPDVE